MNANDPLEAADPSRISLNLRCGAFALALAVSSVALFLPADNADAKGGSSGSVATSASVTGSVVSGAVTVNNAGSQTVNVTAVSSSLEVRFPSGTTPPLLPACTQTDSCQSGFCRGSNPVTCTADHQCELATCDPTTGTCSGQAKADGTECIDGNVAPSATTASPAPVPAARRAIAMIT